MSYIARLGLLVPLSAGVLTVACSNPEVTIGTSQSTTGSESTGTSTGGAGGTPSFAQSGSGSMSTGTTCPAQVTCEGQGANCGPMADGCGGVLNCGDCTVAGDTCGGSGMPNVCGQFTCTPGTCQSLGKNCGPVGDGCGALIPDCGSCNQPETCGGAMMPSVCGIPATCTNLCLQQVTCPPDAMGNAVTTAITGIVRAPGKAPSQGGDPLMGALVYIPNAPVAPFTPGVACEKCDANVSGSPLVSATTGPDGVFTLTNVPVGSNIPLVIQLGRWRRQVVIPTVAQCTDTPLTGDFTRLPRNKSEGDIPHMAIATGSVDSLECVLRKIGIDDAEFTNPSGNGRIHVFTGLGSGGSRISAATPTEGTLWNATTTLDQYDMVLFPCQGNEYYTNRMPNAQWPAAYQRLLDYTGAGGRIFATHYSYVWMHGKGGTGPGPWELAQGIADWQVDQASPADQNGIIDQSFPKGQAFAQWLVNVAASTMLGIMPIKVVRHDLNSVGMKAQQWMSASNPMGVPLHFTFNTPTTSLPDDQCGRVVFSDFHVSNASTGGTTFPAECNNAAMTPQEKLVEFMLFDLGSCVTPDIPTCDPLDCAAQNLSCGPAGDGCGNIIQCGDCPPGETCGGGGMPGVCGNNPCMPQTCQSLMKNCGPVGDGCGNLLMCGMCTPPQTCGGGGVANVCGGGGPG